MRLRTRRAAGAVGLILALGVTVAGCELPAGRAGARCAKVGAIAADRTHLLRCNAKRRWERGLSIATATALFEQWKATFQAKQPRFLVDPPTNFDEMSWPRGAFAVNGQTYAKSLLGADACPGTTCERTQEISLEYAYRQLSGVVGLRDDAAARGASVCRATITAPGSAASWAADVGAGPAVPFTLDIGGAKSVRFTLSSTQSGCEVVYGDVKVS